MRNCLFSQNTVAGLYGGGAVALVLSGSTSTLSSTSQSSLVNIDIADCTFTGNSVQAPLNALGGALSIFSTSAAAIGSVSTRLERCFFSGNSVSTSGTGEAGTGIEALYGGAVSVFYTGNAANCDFRAEQSAFVNNTANPNSGNTQSVWAGAVSIFYNAAAVNCSAALVGDDDDDDDIQDGNNNNNYNNNNNNNESSITAITTPASTGNSVLGASGSTYGGLLSVFYNASAADCSQTIAAMNMSDNSCFNNNSGPVFGGAVSVFYSGNASSCTTVVKSSVFGMSTLVGTANSYGGSVSVYYSANAVNCPTTISRSTFHKSTINLVFNEGADAFLFGGAVSIYHTGNAMNSNVYLAQSVFAGNALIGNTACSLSNGGAVSVYWAANSWNSSTFVNGGQYLQNTALDGSQTYGGALSVSFNNIVNNGGVAVVGPVLFSANSVSATASVTQAVTTIGGAISVACTTNAGGGAATVNISQAQFVNNTVSADYSSNSGVTAGTATVSGGAVGLQMQTSMAVVITQSVFSNNSASALDFISSATASGGALSVGFAGSGSGGGSSGGGGGGDSSSSGGGSGGGGDGGGSSGTGGSSNMVVVHNNTFTSCSASISVCSGCAVYGGAVNIAYQGPGQLVNSVARDISNLYLSNIAQLVPMPASSAPSPPAPSWITPPPPPPPVRSGAAYGGALCISYLGGVQVTSSSTSVVDSKFTSNAVQGTGYASSGNGGAVSVMYSALSTANASSVNIGGGGFLANTVSGNLSQAAGGAVSVLFAAQAWNTMINLGGDNSSNNNSSSSSSSSSSSNSNVLTIFNGNLAACQANSLGGAISVYFAAPDTNCTTTVESIMLANNSVTAITSSSSSSSSSSSFSQMNAISRGGALGIYHGSVSQLATMSIGHHVVFSNNTASASTAADLPDTASGTLSTAVGGAVAVYFAANAVGCSCLIQNTSLSDNVISAVGASRGLGAFAVGGAVSVYFNAAATDCVISLWAVQLVRSLATATVGADDGIMRVSVGSGFIYGGALSVFFTNLANATNISIVDSLFISNTAIDLYPTNNNDGVSYGGGVSLYWTQGSVGGSATVSSCTFLQNVAGANQNGIGGAVSLFSNLATSSNTFTISASLFKQNVIAGGARDTGQGGAVSISLPQSQNDSVKLQNGSVFMSNVAQSAGMGGAVSVSMASCSQSSVTITHCAMSANVASGALARALGGAVAINWKTSSSCSAAITGTSFTGNDATFGSAVLFNAGCYLQTLVACLPSTSVSFVLQNCSIQNHTADLAGSVGIILTGGNVRNVSGTNGGSCVGSGGSGSGSGGSGSGGGANSGGGSGGGAAASSDSGNSGGYAEFGSLAMGYIDVPMCGSRVEVSSTLFANNGASGGFGGGLLVAVGNIANTSVLVRNSTMLDNSAVFGGAFAVTTSGLFSVTPTSATSSSAFSSASVAESDIVWKNNSIQVVDTLFEGNTAQTGGAVYLNTQAVLNTSFSFLGANFLGNAASQDAGGIFVSTSSPMIQKASSSSSSTSSSPSSSPSTTSTSTSSLSASSSSNTTTPHMRLTIQNSTFVLNTALVAGGAVLVKPNSDVLVNVHECNMLNNSGPSAAVLAYSGQGGYGGIVMSNSIITAPVSSSSSSSSSTFTAVGSSSSSKRLTPSSSSSLRAAISQSATVVSQIEVSSLAIIQILANNALTQACSPGAQKNTSMSANSWSIVCSTCKRDTYQLNTPKCAGQAPCLTCPADATCNGGTRIETQSG